MYVIYSDVDGVRDIMLSPRNEIGAKSIRDSQDKSFTEGDKLLKIDIEEGMQVVGFFAKLRNTEVPVAPA